MKKIQKPILVTQSTLPPFEEYVEKINTIWKSHWLTNQGVLHQELQKKLETFLECKYVELCVNGHSALDVLVKSLELKGEVITTPFTFVSTIHALSMNNIKPVFCDIKDSDYTIDEDKVESLITSKTSAILGVHVYGLPCNIIKLWSIAKKHHIKLIFDAAHAFGVQYKGKSVASYGDASMFSFHATKVFNTIEGGAVAQNNLKLQEKMNLIKNFGISDPEHIIALGLNAKMNEFQAAMGLCNLKYLDASIASRKLAAEAYDKGLKKIPGIKLVKINKNITKYNYAYYPIVIDEKEYGLTRDELFKKLAQNKIFARKYFYPLISDCDYYRESYKDASLPIARYVAKRVLTLPLFSGLEPEIVSAICSVIQSCYKK